jgi:hypothetical protein
MKKIKLFLGKKDKKIIFAPGAVASLGRRALGGKIFDATIVVCLMG